MTPAAYNWIRCCGLTVLTLILSAAISQNKPTAKKTASSTIHITFKPIKSLPVFARQYPFLARYLETLKSEMAAPMETTLLSAAVTLPNAKLLFLRLEGSLYRGTAGAPVDVYLDRGAGFKPALSVTTYDDIQVVDKPTLSLILHTGEGKPVRWVLNRSNQFEKQ